MKKLIAIIALAAVAAGAGISFNGSNTHGWNAVGAVKSNPNDMTLAAWFRRQDGGDSDDWIFGISFNNLNDQFCVALAKTNVAFAQVYSSTMGSGRQALYTNTITAGQWVHVAATMQTGSVELYFDGVSVATNSSGWTMNAGVGSAGVVQIGGAKFGATVYSPFLGDLAEAVIYDRVLTPAEIAGLAAGQSPLTMPASLVFYDPLASTNGWNMVRSPRTTWYSTTPTPTSHPKTYRP